MRKLFIQFYLLLMASFLLMALVIGGVYRLTFERTMDKSLDDLMQGALSLLRNELRHTPQTTGQTNYPSLIPPSRLISRFNHSAHCNLNWIARLNSHCWMATSSCSKIRTVFYSGSRIVIT